MASTHSVQGPPRQLYSMVLEKTALGTTLTSLGTNGTGTPAVTGDIPPKNGAELVCITIAYIDIAGGAVTAEVGFGSTEATGGPPITFERTDEIDYWSSISINTSHPSVVQDYVGKAINSPDGNWWFAANCNVGTVTLQIRIDWRYAVGV